MSSSGNTAAQRRRLEDLLRLPENRECCDCTAKQPRWASTNLGVFFCLRCAGLHRAMGTHVSKVKSTTMDTWEESMIHCCECIGNERGRVLYEYSLPPHVKPNPSTDNATVEGFIRSKYERKLYHHPQHDAMFGKFLTIPPQPTAMGVERAPLWNQASKGEEWSGFVESKTTATTSAAASMPMLWGEPSPPVPSAAPTKHSGLSVDELFSTTAPTPALPQQQAMGMMTHHGQRQWGQPAGYPTPTAAHNYHYNQQQQQQQQQQHQQQQRQQSFQAPVHQQAANGGAAQGDVKSEIMSLFANPTPAQQQSAHVYSAWQPRQTTSSNGY